MINKEEDKPKAKKVKKESKKEPKKELKEEKPTLDEEVPEVEEAKINTQVRPNVFGNQLIPVEQLEQHSGTFQIEKQIENIKNLSLLTSAVKPFDQVLELDEEWNYDVLHTEIGQIVRAQYGEFYQK